MSDNNRQAALNCLAGSVGGVGQVLAGQPFDTIKVRIQSQPKEYRGAFDCLKKLVGENGVQGLYKGTTSPLMGISVCVSLQFLTLEKMKQYFADRNMRAGQQAGQLLPSQLFLAGGVAGLANSVASCPVEHIRTRLQIQNAGQELYSGTIDCVKKISAEYGVSALYKGMVPTLYREFFGYGAYFLAYEYFVARELAKSGGKRADLASWKVCLYGSYAGFSMWLLCFPIDAIKTKIQTDAFAANARYKSTLDCLTSTLKSGGVAGLYRGLSPCLLRAAPANAATFICFEYAMRFLQTHT
ncbi:hypothetical protein BB561_000515 [Smittium simulii]|uniref:Mitochondrial carrier protein n=1 Tax=Smittium simulii TaxID=133385 RepID=A0A2T9YYW7_9FUNG|nr:hypothetical protein BB561_000515 [Smittium simulii]